MSNAEKSEKGQCMAKPYVAIDIFLILTNTNSNNRRKDMAKSKQINHEYYANFETCRNRMFDMFDPDWLQIEDAHLSYEEAFEEDDE